MRKLGIYPYNLKFPEIFKKEREKISKVIKNCEIHHIGSTAVPGLGGKGIIDIMIGINDWKEAKEIVKKLKNLGFTHVHPKENGRIFLSNKKGTTFGDLHIHIVKKRSKEHKEHLSFRDYLRKNKKEIKRFFKLKRKWWKESRRNREKYNKLKERYVEEILRKVKKKNLTRE